MEKVTILHLCADTGSDSKPWKDAGHNVILVGKAIGVENFHAPEGVYGVIANPVCTTFSTARNGGVALNPQDGMFLVEECLRVIEEANPHFWVIENPARGVLKDYLGEPQYKYQPWWYGSPWTKATALWGKFTIPERVYYEWESVPKLEGLYQRPGRGKPALAFMHSRKHLKYIPEFAPFIEIAHRKGNSRSNGADMEFRSLCSQKFAQAFYEANKPM